MPRDTTTGSSYEAVIETALARVGCAVAAQVDVGQKPGGGRHKIDLLASGPDGRAIISVKVQNTSGTAEEKLTYEVIKLIHALDGDPTLTHAYIVLGGTGWSPGMREFIARHVAGFVPRATAVQVMGTDDFLTHVALKRLFVPPR